MAAPAGLLVSRSRSPPGALALLTVTERSRRIPAEAAFACRIAWGTAESLLIYRSLAAPERRAFLGYQTTCRLFMGLFTAKGDVEPILEIED